MEEYEQDFPISEKTISKVQERVEIQREVLGFEKLMELANLLAKSTIVPTTYMNRPENCFIALDMASRMGISPMIVMQNLYVIQGKPSWSGAAIASMIRSNPALRNVELIYVGEEGKDTWGAYVTAVNKTSGKTLKGGTVTLAIAKKEGWFQKAGSKWQTMPELMLAYRSFAWFGRVHCSDIMMGMQAVEEVYDSEPIENKMTNPYERSNS
jgi:hypothetical protein